MRNHILPLLLLILCTLVANPTRAQFNPPSPAEPQVPVFRYPVTTSCYPANVAYTSGDGDWAPGDQFGISTSLYSDNYVFDHWAWTIDGEEYTCSEQYFDYTMTDAPVHFVAHYRFTPSNPTDPSTVLKARLHLKSDPAGIASFNRTSGERLEIGASHYICAYPNQGYEFVGWYCGDERVSYDRSFYYEMPDAEVTLTARFKYSPDNPPNPDDNDGSLIIPDDELQGDINGDDEVDVLDLKYLVKIVLKKAEEVDAADVNRNLKVNIGDVTTLIDILKNANK